MLNMLSTIFNEVVVPSWAAAPLQWENGGSGSGDRRGRHLRRATCGRPQSCSVGALSPVAALWSHAQIGSSHRTDTPQSPATCCTAPFSTFLGCTRLVPVLLPCLAQLVHTLFAASRDHPERIPPHRVKFRTRSRRNKDVDSTQIKWSYHKLNKPNRLSISKILMHYMAYNR